MRACVIVTLFLALGACGDDSSTTDLAVDAAPGELSRVEVGCAGYLECIDACLVSATFQSCTLSCGAVAKAGASDRFVAALACDQDHCMADLDTRSGRCARTGSEIVNLDGSDPMMADPADGSDPMKACYWCLHDASAQLFGEACATMSSPDCNPTECVHLVNLCLDDRP